MSSNGAHGNCDDTPAPPSAPARRMTQRELVILSLLARADDSPPRGLT